MSELLSMLINLACFFWWIYPFAFVLFLLAAINSTTHDGPNDIAWGTGAAVSLFLLVLSLIYR